jgi:glycosyltransferase involved in cell wall biosynthesis
VNKLVTIITPTWGRPKTILKHAIPSVARQTYPEIEHIIIPDGFDPELNEILMNEGYTPDGDRKRLVWLGRNWSGFIGRDGMGDASRMVGGYLARGEYISYLCDDNDLREDYVEKFVELLDDGADIALCPWDENPDAANLRADANSFMHRVELLKNGSWNLRDGRDADQYLVRRWVNEEGARWTYHNEPTLHLNRHNGGHGAPDGPND